MDICTHSTMYMYILKTLYVQSFQIITEVTDIIVLITDIVMFSDRLHLHNLSLETQSLELKEVPTYVDRFGFESSTCCGFIPMPNEWTSDWTVCLCVNS